MVYLGLPIKNGDFLWWMDSYKQVGIGWMVHVKISIPISNSLVSGRCLILRGRRTSINDPDEWYPTFLTGWNNVVVALGKLEIWRVGWMEVAELERWHLLFKLAWPYPHYNQNCSGQHQQIRTPIRHNQTLNPHSKFQASFNQTQSDPHQTPDPGPSNFQATRNQIVIP
jgi:hypothetical protein